MGNPGPHAKAPGCRVVPNGRSFFSPYNLTLRPYEAPFRSRSLHAFGVIESSGRLLGTHRHHADRPGQSLHTLGHAGGDLRKARISRRGRVLSHLQARALLTSPREAGKSRGSRRGTPEHECSLCSSRRAQFRSVVLHVVTRSFENSSNANANYLRSRKP